MLRDAANARTGVPAAAPKRSLFNKPNWAAKRTSVTKAEIDFFDHRDSTYSGILAEKEKKREKYRTKASTKAEERNGRELKRRRLSEDEDSVPESESHDEEEEVQIVTAEHEGPVTRSAPTRKATLSPNDRVKQHSSVRLAIPPSTNIIELEDDEDEANPLPGSCPDSKRVSPIKPRRAALSSDADSEDEDEYTLELKRKAREKARLRKLDCGAPKSITPEPATTKRHSPQVGGPSPSESTKSSSEAPLHDLSPPSSTPKKEDDAEVEILIRPAIPGTRLLIVKRKVWQSLQPVKEVWCKRQGFDAAMTRKVFLTWRGNKLFNATTPTHILKMLKAEKNRSGIGCLDDDDEDLDPSKGKIEVEAVTEDILAERKRLKAKEDLRAENGTGDEGGPSEEAGEPQPQKEPDLQLMLNSPGLEPVLLKVRQATLVGKIMAGFKKIRQVEQGKTCWLIFDGERLDPETSIGDTEIEDSDVIDVQIR